MPKKTTKLSMDSTVKKRIKIGREIIRENVKTIHQHFPRGTYDFEHLDYDEVRIERRIQAAARMYEDARRFLSTVCPDQTAMQEKVWMAISLAISRGYDVKDQGEVFSVACAVWMLDQLKRCGRLEEARQLVPQDDEICDDVKLPDIWDASHDEASVRGMLWIIKHRNDDCKGTTSNKETNLHRIFMDDHTARGVQHQQVPSRQRFESILAMIPQFGIDQAVRHFEEAYYEVLRRMYISNCHFFDMHAEIMKKKKRLCIQLDLLGMEAMVPNAADSQMSHALPIRNEMILRRERLQAEMRETVQAEQRISKAMGTCAEHIGRIHMFSAEHVESVFTPEIAEIWEDFTVSDPFEMCFAFLYLVDRNSDLPWIYCVTGCLMDFCGRELPWLMIDAPINNLKLGAENDSAMDWYGQFYENSTIADPECRKRYNLSQLLYTLTGCLVPRNPHRNYVCQMLEQYGIRDESTAQAVRYCAAVLEEVRNRNHSRPAPAKEEDTATAAAVEQEMEALTKKIRALEEENKRLRQNEHNAYREARELQKKLEKLEADSELDRMELYNLREIVFNLDQAENETQQENDAVAFPYTSKKKIVIVGGHDSWLREIKPKLPDVRYISRHENPDLQIIRNADVVWFQTNAMSHNLYERIIGETRARKIRTEYFNCASARRCAMKLVMKEEK